MISSVLTSCIDFALFITAYKLYNNILFSMIIARALASVFNFLINKNYIFHIKFDIYLVLKYYLLVLIMVFFAYIFINNLVNQFGVNIFILKAFIETILFLINFVIQRDFVFIKKGHNLYEKN